MNKKTIIIILLISTHIHPIHTIKYSPSNDNDCTNGACIKCSFITEQEQKCSQCAGFPLKITDEGRKLGHCDTNTAISAENCDIQDPSDDKVCLSCNLGYYLESGVCQKGVISDCAKYFRNTTIQIASKTNQENDLECFLCYPGYSPSKDRKSCNRIWFPKSRKCVFHTRGNKPKAEEKEFCFQCIEGFFPEVRAEDGSYQCVKHSEMESCSFYGWESGTKKCNQCERLGGYFAVNSDSNNGQTCSHEKSKDWRTEALKHAPFLNGWVLLELVGAVVLFFVIVKVVLFLKRKKEVEDEEHLKSGYPEYDNVSSIMDG